MKYVKIFETHTEHESQKSELMKLDYACTYCMDNQDSWFWYKRPSFADQYLTFESLEDNNTIEIKTTNTTGILKYSINDGETWISLASNVRKISVTLNTNEKVSVKADLNFQYDVRNHIRVSSSGNFNVMGNIMSIIYGDNFIGQTSFKNNSGFYQMFLNCTTLISAQNLILPAISLYTMCYYCMFQGCTSLTTAPELPAIELVDQCYSHMFDGCTSLNYIKAMFTTTPHDGFTVRWVYNVASSGIFVKNSAAEWDITADNAIPPGWTVQYADN